MKRLKDLHHKAMAWAEKADLARIRGVTDEVQPFLEKALALEREAALLCANDLEPTRSVLYRSAATLALQCKHLRDAEQLIAAGLAGEPQEEIANELRNLMERVWHERHRVAQGALPSARHKSHRAVNGKTIEVKGLLKFADDRRKTVIRVIGDDKSETTFIVPPNMMNEIVPPFWDKRVVVKGFLKGRHFLLQEIRAA